MSYCRWSSDDYQCDVYVWADVAGTWRTEVAGRRRIFTVPMPPEVTLPVGEAQSPERHAWAEATAERMVTVSRLVDDESLFAWLELPDPEGGHSYEHDTPGECADNLVRLRAAGYNVPQYAIDSLLEEQTSDADPE